MKFVVGLSVVDSREILEEIVILIFPFVDCSKTIPPDFVVLNRKRSQFKSGLTISDKVLLSKFTPLMDTSLIRSLLFFIVRIIFSLL
jgi:hypothetical protein